MDDFTYQRDNYNSKLETYEWDNAWIEQTQKNDKKRVLFIGDSISCGTRRIATAVSGEKYLFDGFGTSKSIDNPFFEDSVKLFYRQENELSAVIFNNGLHGWHLSLEEYERNYERFIAFLKNTFKDIPVLLVLTTGVENDEEQNKRVVARNEAVLRLAEKYKLDVIDLYKISQENKAEHTRDGIHFSEKGYTELAKCIVSELDKVL